MTISYGSICSGIEAATVAWHPLGWRAEWFAEIEPFPSAVLAYRWWAARPARRLVWQGCAPVSTTRAAN